VTRQARRPASIEAYIGATGSGKTTAWRQAGHLEAARLVVWDYKREHNALPAVASMRELLQHLARPTFRVRVLPPMDRAACAAWFDVTCRGVYAAGDATLIVEELAFVTTPQRAPDSWRLLSLTGRDYQVHGRRSSLRLVWTSQRPASVDKDALGNATSVWCGRCVAVADVRTMAAVMQVPDAELRALRDLQYIRRDNLTGQVERGTLRVGRLRGADATAARK
jgi:hypothetical protein